jgi:hypothetical protein
MKKKYTIFASWEICGMIEIEAESIEEAMRIGEDETPLSEYNDAFVEDSFFVDEALVRDYNGE